MNRQMKMLQEYWASTGISIGIFSQCSSLLSILISKRILNQPTRDATNSKFIIFCTNPGASTRTKLLNSPVIGSSTTMSISVSCTLPIWNRSDFKTSILLSLLVLLSGFKLKLDTWSNKTAQRWVEAEKKTHKCFVLNWKKEQPLNNIWHHHWP